ncbi:MAG: TerB N-terminal domain-containing protein [Chloroflexi bacterium]|nr:TerB N-terminal domain-containing protein [Chloroflexota bacterium]
MFFNTRAKKEQAELKRLLAEMQSEKQQLRDHWTARFSEVDSKNAILDQSRSRLENLLKESLLVDTCIIFDGLKIQARLPEFKRKEPILQLPAPPSGLASWLPWKNRSYEKACASAERNYQKALVVYREASFNNKKRVSQIRAEAEKHNQDIEQFLQDFVAGEAGAVVRYFKLVLKNSEYPPGFSKKAELAYFPESRLLKISYDLPAMDIIPETEAYKYAKSRDEITEIVLPQKQRRQFYASVLAQTSLRTIYEIFTADRTEKIEHIVFEGYVDAINPGTGQPGRFCLIALDVQREHFLDLNLQQVEPVACLKGLNARVSSKPDLLLSVSSSSGEERDDAQGPAVSDADMLQALNIRIGELDDEIQEQKQRNAELENELSDKRDRIAELIRDLREEQERSAVLSAAIHAQKDDTFELRAKPSEETGDVLPAITTAAEDSTSRDSAAGPPAKPAWFHQIRAETPADEPAGTPIPPRRPDPETALLFEVMSVIIEAEREYVDYIGAGLPKAAINRLTQDGKLERNKFQTYKFRVTPAGKAWYDEQLQQPQLDEAIQPATQSDTEPFHPIITELPVEDPGDISIPPRLSVLQSSSASRGFIDEARKYVNRIETAAEEVPFMQYWPTYSAMSEAQQQWYFYWRTELRQGNQLPTDLSYLFVHVYEVINLIGFDSPQAAYKHLEDFWRYYRKLQPKLDKYLPDWNADFIVVHKLLPDPLQWYAKVAKLGAVGDLNMLIEGWVNEGENFEALSDDVLFHLAKYNPTENKFYKQHGETVKARSAYKKGVMAFNAAIEKERGQSLFQTYKSKQSRVIKRIPFINALHEYPQTEIEIAIVHPWTDNARIANLLRDILRHTENVMRQQYHFGHQLRGIRLSPKWQSIIETALKLEPPRPEIIIDPAKVEQLKIDSTAIRDRLLVGQIDDNSQEFKDDNALNEAQRNSLEGKRDKSGSVTLRSLLLGDTAQISGSQDGGPASPGFLQDMEGRKSGSLPSLDEVARIMGASGSETARLIAFLSNNDWECAEEDIQSAFRGQFINPIIETINERAYEEIGESLIIEENDLFFIERDYRCKIESILKHSQYGKFNQNQ